MERKLITCPESAHLEEITFERTPFGIVVEQCSRFEPRCAVECAVECARRMDRRDRLEANDQEERVLVLVPARDEAARSIAEILAEALVRDGFVVERADLDLRGAPPPADYDAVVVGATVRGATRDRAALADLEAYQELLADTPWFLFTVGGTASAPAPPRLPAQSAVFGANAAIAERARIQRFAEAIADEVPLVGAAYDIPTACS